jgi:hypothetical protein
MGSVSKTSLEHVSTQKMDVVDPMLKLQSLNGDVTNIYLPFMAIM